MWRRWWGRALVAGYTRAPHGARRSVVRLVTPSYRVGVLVVLRRSDGRLLLVDQPYVPGWSLPGGDIRRRESVREAAVRELREELGLDVAVPEPVLAQQRPHDRWVSFVTSLELPDPVADSVRPTSPELSRIAWFHADRLPPLHGDTVVPLALVGIGRAVNPQRQPRGA